MLAGCAGPKFGRKLPSDEQIIRIWGAAPEPTRQAEEMAGKTFEPPSSAESALYICRAVRKRVAGKRINTVAFYKDAPEELTGPYGGQVSISVYGKRARLFKAAARGNNAAGAALQAIRALARTVKGKLPTRISSWAIKIDFSQELLPVEVRAAAGAAFIPGIDGIYLLPESRGEYRLPAEIMSFSPATSTDIQLFFSMLPASDKVRRFRTRAFLQPKEGLGVLKLTRSLPPAPEVTEEVLKRRIVAAGEYLVRNQRPDGSYPYLYRAVSDRFSRTARESMVRHAAAPAMMILAGEALGRKDFIDSAASCLDYLQTRLRREQGLAYLLKKDEGILGGSGVLAWTISHYRRVTGSTKYDQLAREAVDFILFMRKPDGSFYNYYDPETKKPLQGVSRYYQGEACLGLYWYYKVYGERKYLDAALRGAAALAQRCEKLLRKGELYIDAWLMQAARFLYPHASEAQKEQMLNVVEAMADLTVKAQRTKRTPGYRDLIGSFRSATQRLPSGPGTAALCEGVAATWHLLKSLGKPADEVKAVLVRAAPFLLRHQYWGANMYFLANPARAKGGIKGTLTDNRVRVDHVQHTAACLLEVLKILQENSQK